MSRPIHEEPRDAEDKKAEKARRAIRSLDYHKVDRRRLYLLLEEMMDVMPSLVDELIERAKQGKDGRHLRAQ